MSTTAPQSSFHGEETHRAWKCGEAYTHVPTDGFGSTKSSKTDVHWKSVTEYLAAKEAARCDAWKDEVQNLLVFSGLFSAVVTGLLVESHKTLREDPVEALLTKISSALVNATDQTRCLTPQGIPCSFSASPSNKRVNALWFLSLVFSLATALFGIVSLQWLRAHLLPSTQNVPLRVLPAFLHMQSDAIERFHVTGILTALPLLLIIGLVFFLVGMIDFLWNLNQEVAIPVVTAIALTFAFLIYTTIRPGLQSFPIHISSSTTTTPRSPCPYKSPQSWAFLKLVTSIKAGFRTTLRGILRALDTFGNEDRREELVHRFFARQSGELGGQLDDWIQYGTLWLRQRDIDALAGHGDPHKLLPHFCNPLAAFSPIYDCTQALLKVKEDLTVTRSDTIGQLYQCFQDFTNFSHGSENRFAFELISFIHDCLLPATPMSGALPRELIRAAPRPEIISDNTRLLFMLHSTSDLDSRDHSLTLHHLELCVRLTRSVLGFLPLEVNVQKGLHVFPIDILRHHISRTEISSSFRSAVIDQVLQILEAFFQTIIEYNPSENELGRTMQTSESPTWFIMGAARVIAPDYSRIQVPHDRLLSRIFHQLTQANGTLDYLFLAASVYVRELLCWPTSEQYRPTDEFRALLQALRDYQSRCEMTHIIKLQEFILPETLRAFWSWEFLDEDSPASPISILEQRSSFCSYHVEGISRNVSHNRANVNSHDVASASTHEQNDFVLVGHPPKKRQASKPQLVDPVQDAHDSGDDNMNPGRMSGGLWGSKDRTILPSKIPNSSLVQETVIDIDE